MELRRSRDPFGGIWECSRPWGLRFSASRVLLLLQGLGLDFGTGAGACSVYLPERGRLESPSKVLRLLAATM